jgi:hypothetical protein
MIELVIRDVLNVPPLDVELGLPLAGLPPVVEVVFLNEGHHLANCEKLIGFYDTKKGVRRGSRIFT